MARSKKSNFENTTERQIENILKTLQEKILKKFKQEIVAETHELSERELIRYRCRVSKKSWKLAQKWCKWENEGPVLLPDHTRFYYRKGKSEVLMLEYPPQVRLFKFNSSLAKRMRSTDSAPSDNKVYHYSLGIPYLNMIFLFVDGVFKDVYVSFCDRPLKNLREKPLLPFLSNIDDTLRLCLGSSFNRTELEKGNIKQQAALVLNSFWQTIYSDEWSKHFWNYRAHFASNEKINSLDAWQESTIDNYLFVLEDVQWIPHNEMDYGKIIERLFENEKDDLTFQTELYDSLTEEFMEKIKQTHQDALNDIEQKFQNVQNKEIEIAVKKIIEELQSSDDTIKE